MIFPKVKRAVVKYIIDTDHSKETTGFIPKGLFLNIQKHSSATEIGCPATNSANNKFFNILSPISFDLVFGCDEFNTPYWRYEFDTTKHKDIGSKNSVRKILDNTISLSSDKEEKSLQAQFTLPYAFVTDVEDTSLTLLPPHNIKYENCFFATGEFIFTDWIRHLTSAWVLEDKNKEAVVHFEVGEPCICLLYTSPSPRDRG